MLQKYPSNKDLFNGWNVLGEIDKMFNLAKVPITKNIEPKMDVFHTETDVIILVDVPGIDKKDLSISVEESSFTISGEFKSNYENDKENYIYHERSYGKFSKTVSLPVEVDSKSAKAKFEDGVLIISIPKIKVKEKSFNINID